MSSSLRQNVCSTHKYLDNNTVYHHNFLVFITKKLGKNSAEGRRDRQYGQGSERSGNNTFHENLPGREKSHLRRINAFDIGLIALGAALNVAAGYLVSILKLPLYLDSIGTVLISVLCGWVHGLVVGLSALVILTLTAVPTVIAYAGTAVVIALGSAFMGRFGFLRDVKVTVIGGLIIGIAAAAVSVPVTTLLYGGVSLAGADAITTIFKTAGMPLWKSVLFGSLFTDTFDKIITSLICLTLIRSLPPRMLLRFSGKKAIKPDGSEHSLDSMKDAL